MPEFVQYEVRERVAMITMNRPDAMNARNLKMRQEIAECVQEADRTPEVSVLVLTGTGRAFSTGRDLKEASQAPAESIVQARNSRRAVRDTDTLAGVDKPVIAAINGFALGGGLELALCCDLRIAAAEAKLGLPEVSRGMMPGSGGTQRLARVVGVPRALEMMLTGQAIDAQEALRIGLVNRVVPGKDLLDTVLAVAGQIAKNAPVALRYVKESVLRGWDMSLADGLRLEAELSAFLSTTADRVEGARAFVEKREPNWQGK